jgi:membrane protein DedA with SNARE-associated domain
MNKLVLSASTNSLRYYLHLANPLTRFITQLILHHQAIAVFSVIALEEMGIPLPLPGDIFIMYAGHLVASHRVNFWSAFLAVVFGAVIGSSILYWIARIYGKHFVRRYGPYMHIHSKRLEQAEKLFKKWGPLFIIIGRHIPGFRMLISVFSGVFGVSWPTFAVSVAISSSIWALLFLGLGISLNRQIGPYLTITPAHLLPGAIFLSLTISYAFYLRHQEKKRPLGNV